MRSYQQLLLPNSMTYTVVYLYYHKHLIFESFPQSPAPVNITELNLVSNSDGPQQMQFLLLFELSWLKTTVPCF